ncbi:hypothetical protein [Brazilian marseillevirus]|uniref:hypothetical protein n=1 Tax=Brazilian marseillevirus TaxID=1813599 RepID=UPI0007831470|nr:hypothetical protein A3303_gp024 [Brazilian marseillevirus]AMQ10532.1 hypothetical protein [Brazilian marseillevirus]
MELTGLVFSRSSPTKRSLYFVVRKGTTMSKKVLMSPVPAIITRLGIETWSCHPDWNKVQDSLDNETTKISAKVGDDDGIPFLQVKKNILRLCLEDEDDDIYTP